MSITKKFETRIGITLTVLFLVIAVAFFLEKETIEELKKEKTKANVNHLKKGKSLFCSEIPLFGEKILVNETKYEIEANIVKIKDGSNFFYLSDCIKVGE